MTTLADLNVLLPILVANHALHQSAWRWWEAQSGTSVGLCLLSRMGVLRLLTNARVMAGNPVTPTEALGAWDSLSSDPRCVWIEPDPGHEVFFRQFVKGRASSPNLWTDTWLAALAAANGYRLTSFDAGFRSFQLPDFELLTP